MARGNAGPKWVFPVLAVAAALYSLMQSLAVPAIPVYQRLFDTDQGTAAWVFTSFLLAASVATPIVGRAGDLYGRRRLLVISLVMLAVGSVIAAAAPSMSVLLVGRVVQGLSGGIIPLAFGVLRDELPPAARPQAIAMISSLVAVGFAIGLVVSGYVVDHFGFRWLFILPAIVSASVVVLVRRVVSDTPGNGQGPVNILSGLLFAAWLSALLIGVSQAPYLGWLAAPVISTGAVAMVLCAVWVIVELRARVPLIDLRLMRLPAIAAPNLVALLIGLAMFGSFGYIPQLLQTPTSTGYGLGASVAQSGLIMFPAALASFAAGLIGAKLANRWGTRVVVSSGAALTAIGLVQLALFHGDALQVAVATGVHNFGAGAVFACLANAVVAAAPQSSVGIATAMNANIRTVGGAIGSAAVATILVATTTSAGYPAHGGYVAAFLILAGAGALASVAGLLIAKDR